MLSNEGILALRESYDKIVRDAVGQAISLWTSNRGVKTLRSHHLAPPNPGIKMRFIRRREKASDWHVACYRNLR